MNRDLFNELVAWRISEMHLPLLLRGARQVGKTHLVESFGQRHFENIVTINFEQRPQFADCFKSLEPQDIINALSLASNKTIKPHSTLLFLDEIQECPAAIMALRYFKEQLPALHVIGAGSLLEFVLNDSDFRMPVGRVQDIYLYPLSFDEYLTVMGEQRLRDYLSTVKVTDHIVEPVHQQLLKRVQEYMVLGGMPMVIDHYIKNAPILECQRYQQIILNTYQNDFGKYASKANYKYLQTVFTKSPGFIGQQVKYSKLSEEYRSRELKEAIINLYYARILQPVYATAAAGLPLKAYMNENRFKLLFLDVGLLQRNANIDIQLLMQTNMSLLTQGALTEQFVGQELLAYTDPYTPAQLFYWTRDKKGSQAEVDYVISVDSHVIPIEVKSGKAGRLKSLQIFLQEKNLGLGIKISQQPLVKNSNVLSIPFYLISQIPRLIREHFGSSL